MKNRLRSLISVLLVLVLLLSCAVTSAQAGDDVSVDVNAKFMYKEARSMLNLINSFRTGKDANYKDKNNKKVKVKGLKKLEYDYNLEKVAMLRALEIAVYFSHTRPNGKKWSSAHSGKYTMGENIAYGFGSAKAAFKAFREDDEDYSGQGHRRNMLQKDFTRVGFGCVKVGNTMYWAQEFGSGKAGGSSSDKFSAKSVEATWKMLTAGKTKVSVSSLEIEIGLDESIELPKVILSSSSGAKNSLHGAEWSSSDKKVAKIDGSKLVAVSVGETDLTINVNGSTLQVKVEVVAKSAPGSYSAEDIEEYDTPLGTEETEFFFLDDEDIGFFEEGDIPESDE